MPLCPHNPEVAGSNPAPATRKCRSEAWSPERRSGLLIIRWRFVGGTGPRIAADSVQDWQTSAHLAVSACDPCRWAATQLVGRALPFRPLNLVIRRVSGSFGGPKRLG